MSQIQITCDTPDAQIYYSINNENLNILYNEPFDINETSTIYAIGRKEGYEESEVLNKEIIKLPTPQISSMNKDSYSIYIVLNNLNDYTPYVNEEENNISFILEFRNEGFNEIRANKTYKEIKESEDNYLYRRSVGFDSPTGVGVSTYFATATSTDYITSEEGAC